MREHQINRVSSVLLILLSATALVSVGTGLIWPPLLPEADEGTQAHVFQLSIAGLLPMTVIVVGTADWSQPRRSLLPLVIAFIEAGLAFAGLYYLEHLR
jgi:hypothetical protein